MKVQRCGHSSCSDHADSEARRPRRPAWFYALGFSPHADARVPLRRGAARTGLAGNGRDIERHSGSSRPCPVVTASSLRQERTVTSAGGLELHTQFWWPPPPSGPPATPPRTSASSRHGFPASPAEPLGTAGHRGADLFAGPSQFQRDVRPGSAPGSLCVGGATRRTRDAKRAAAGGGHGISRIRSGGRWMPPEYFANPK